MANPTLDAAARRTAEAEAASRYVRYRVEVRPSFVLHDSMTGRMLEETLTTDRAKLETLARVGNELQDRRVMVYNAIYSVAGDDPEKMRPIDAILATMRGAPLVIDCTACSGVNGEPTGRVEADEGLAGVRYHCSHCDHRWHTHSLLDSQ